MSNSVNLSLDVTKTGIQNPLIKVRQGDGGFETLHTTVTSNGEPMDLQGWTITFMGTTAGNHKIVDGNVTLVEAPNGIFDYTPSKAWGMDIGEFKIAYFKFVKGDDSASSANFRVNVIEAVDLTQEEAQHYISVVDAAIAEAREHLESSLADVSSSVAATSSAVNSMAIFASSATSSAVSQANSAASNASSVASNAVSQVNSASGIYVKKSGDTMTGGLTGGQTILPDYGDLNALTETGKYYQTKTSNAVNWKNRPVNAPNFAFSVDVIGNGSNSLVTQVYYVHTTNRMWVRTIWLDGTIQGSAWAELANDAQLVHKTGTESIAGDKTFTGNTNFSGGITAPQVTATDLLTGFHNVIQVPDTTTSIVDLINNDLIKGRGFWKEATFIAFNRVLSDAPTNDAYSIINVATRGTNRTYVEYSDLSGNVWHTTASSNSLNSWVKQANDSEVLHKTGNETSAGDKTFTGKVTADNLVSNSVPVSLTKTTTSKMWYSSTLTAYRTGNTVTIVNNKQDTSVIADNTASTETIPAGYRPSTVLFYPVVYGSSLKGELQINTDGTFTARGAINGQYRLTATYITGDAWPV